VASSFGSYTIVEPLGVGGMATVDRAYVKLPDDTLYEVALKRILPHLESDPRYVDLFVREATLASQLQHPRIVKVFEQGWVGTTCFIALELIHGDPLMVLMYQARKARTRAPVGVMVALMVELCDALDYVHHGEDARGDPRRIVHRDLTPANLIVTDDGHLKVIDFGVAKTTRGKHSTDSGQPKGKLGYMPFEALEGRPVDARADIFSVGVVMWELLCGRRLFKGASDWEVMDKIRAGSVPPPSSINENCPTELDEVVLRAVSRDYIERWPSAGALRVELEHVRRNYHASSTPEAVVAWKHALAAAPPPAVAPHDPQDEPDMIIEIHDVPPADDEISEVNMDGFSDAPFVRRTATPPPIEDAGPTKLFAKRPSDAPPPLDFADEHDTQP
jgi:serine/threonine-protein kinase